MEICERVTNISSDDLRKVLRMEIFPRVQKAGRYIGGEVNSIVKHPERIWLRFALAFPDVYEVGMCSAGMSIIYETVNRLDGVQAERVFAPWFDMEAQLRKRKLPLYGLESFTPLHQFDVVGFSLSYELLGTNMLQILDLAGIPLLSRNRDEDCPIVIAGGCATVNPEPFAEFVDAFCIGDGEELVSELIECMHRTKGMPRRRRLEALAAIEGIYVPQMHETEQLDDGTVVVKGGGASVRMRKRTVANLDDAPFPTAPVIPWVEPIHDRIVIEVFRGCTRGCRFCQVGMVARPVRERSVNVLLQQAQNAVRQSGYDELGLLSLSTCDYSRIEQLVIELFDALREQHVSLSMPSSRIDGFSTDLAYLVQEGRRTGLTFAPEAGTERLRKVINKPVTDVDILNRMEEVFELGWDHIKLYFMIGLPTETDDDVIAIAKLCREILQRGRRVNRRATVNVSIATFIPKPHTPFQWDEQIPIEEAMRKQELLLKHAKQRRLTIRCHDARMSALEGIFARGDRRLSQVLLEAYLRGCRFDGWDEYFNWDAWLAAFDACEIDPWSYLRKRDFDDPLPWDHVDCLVSKSFLQSERMRAVNGAVTPDCRWKGCQGCGVNSAVEQLCERIVITHRDAHKVQGVSRQVSENVRQRYAQVHQMMALEPQQRVRFQFTKLGDLRFLSHLELTKALIRALRRAQLPIAYSRGFNPQPRLAFGPASPVGIESEAEYADAWLERWVSTNDFIQLANAQLPCGCRIVEAVSIPLNADAIAVQLKLSIYQAYVPARLIDGNLQERIARRLSSDEPLIALRETPKGRRRVDIRKVLSNAAVQMVGEGMWMVELHLEDSQSAKGRPDDALRVLCDLDDDALHEIRIIKRSSLCDVNGLLISPLAIVPHHS